MFPSYIQFVLICAFSGGGRFCSRNGYVHPGRSALLSNRLIMDARAWCLQNSWIFRHSSGVLCSPLTECPERKGGLFFQGLKSFCSSKGLDCQKSLLCFVIMNLPQIESDLWLKQKSSFNLTFKSFFPSPDILMFCLYRL